MFVLRLCEKCTFGALTQKILVMRRKMSIKCDMAVVVVFVATAGGGGSPVIKTS